MAFVSKGGETHLTVKGFESWFDCSGLKYELFLVPHALTLKIN